MHLCLYMQQAYQRPEDPPAPAPSSLQIKFNGFDFTSALQLMAHGRELQPSSFWGPTPHSDMWKYGRAKWLHNQGTNMTEMQVEKARLIPQDVLVTRIAMQEVEKLIELLKYKTSGQLLMIQRDNLTCFVICSWPHIRTLCSWCDEHGHNCTTSLK